MPDPLVKDVLDAIKMVRAINCTHYSDEVSAIKNDLEELAGYVEGMTLWPFRCWAFDLIVYCWCRHEKFDLPWAGPNTGETLRDASCCK